MTILAFFIDDITIRQKSWRSNDIFRKNDDTTSLVITGDMTILSKEFDDITILAEKIVDGTIIAQKSSDTTIMVENINDIVVLTNNIENVTILVKKKWLEDI